MGFFDYDPAVKVPKVTWRRLKMLVEELNDFDPDIPIYEVDDLVKHILNAYVKQHFEDSTHVVAQLIGEQMKLVGERGPKRYRLY